MGNVLSVQLAIGEGQDAVTSTPMADGTWLLALADGAGSAAHAQQAAQLASKRCLRNLRRQGRIHMFSLLEAFEDVRRALQQRANETNSPFREWGCTLIAAVVFPTGECLGASVGDSWLAFEHDGTWKSVFVRDRGQFANETRFIVDGSAPIALARWWVTGALAACSDGMDALAWSHVDGAPYSPFFRGLMQHACSQERLDEVFGHPDLVRRLTDDCSLIICR